MYTHSRNPSYFIRNLTTRFALERVLLVMLALPLHAMRAADRGNYNTSDGAFALYALTDGTNNTAIGYDAMRFTTFGSYNTGVGFQVLDQSTSSNWNTAVGYRALYHNTADGNTGVGFEALGGDITGANCSGTANTALGFQALQVNSTGVSNTATGYETLFYNTTGAENTATGMGALGHNTSGGDNTAMGIEALYNNTNGSSNLASGGFALFSNKDGSFNTASGLNALRNNSGGSSNTAAGIQALNNNISGSNNTALGALAGQNLTTGNNNIDIGANVLGVAGESNVIRIGKQGTQKSTFIAGISGVGVTGSQVLVSSNGKLGIATSSARFKEAIKPMDKASEAILALKPVSFRYKEEIDPEGIPQFGLIAEEVEKVNSDLVARDENGNVNTVRYEAVNAMLLNEFLKEHGEVQQQRLTIRELKDAAAVQNAVIAKQQKQIESLIAGLQKVSEQLEVDKATLQLAATHR